MTTTIELGWSITATKFAGAKSAYINSAQRYVPVWCGLNGFVPQEATFSEIPAGNFVVLVTTLTGEFKEQREPPKQPTQEQPKQVGPEQVESEQTPEVQEEPTGEETYQWAYVSELKPGDKIQSGRRLSGTVEEISKVDNRYAVRLVGEPTALIFGLKDRLKRLTK